MTGDLLYLGFRDNNIQFIDEVSFLKGKMNFDFESTKEKRSELAVTRLKALKERQLHVAGSNRLVYHTDASKGGVPLQIVEEALLDYRGIIPNASRKVVGDPFKGVT